MPVYSVPEQGSLASTEAYHLAIVGTDTFLVAKGGRELAPTYLDDIVKGDFTERPPQPLSDLSVTAARDALEAFFNGLANEWHAETDMISSPAEIMSNHAYQRIISIGYAALPFIIRDLLHRGGHWYAALAAITGASPVPPGADVPTAKAAWQAWASREGYID